MTTVFLGLGSNLGDRTQNLDSAIEQISRRIGQVLDQSDFIETEPWGYESANLYVNAVVCVETELSPTELLRETQSIERDLGRLAKTVSEYQDRVIDIDILIYGDLTISNDELTIPHPRMNQREFVMTPLRQLMERGHNHCHPRDDT